MYLYDHWALYRNPATRTRSNTAGVYWSIWMIAIGVRPPSLPLSPSIELRHSSVLLADQVAPFLSQSFLIVGGCLGSVLDIKNSYAAAGGRPFSCKDNSNSV